MDATIQQFAEGSGMPVTRTVSRGEGRAGELVLRERAGHYEIISNGVFLMDTRDGSSERLLMRWALDSMRSTTERRILIAGLGVGWTLGEALRSQDVANILVIEWEPDVVSWNEAITGALTGGHLDDPRVRCAIDDFVAWLQRPKTETFDVICVDVDNGPRWTVSPANRWLYEDHGIAAMRERLMDGGVLTVWSAERDPTFERLLNQRFRHVRHRASPVQRGEPDVIYLAQR